MVSMLCDVQDAERKKVVDKLNSWKNSALQELLDAFDLPKPSEVES